MKCERVRHVATLQQGLTSSRTGHAQVPRSITALVNDLCDNTELPMVMSNDCVLIITDRPVNVTALHYFVRSFDLKSPSASNPTFLQTRPLQTGGYMNILQTICKPSDCLLHTHHDSFNTLHRKRSIHESFWNQFVGKRLTDSWWVLGANPSEFPLRPQLVHENVFFIFFRESEGCSFQPRAQLPEPKHRLLQ